MAVRGAPRRNKGSGCCCGGFERGQIPQRFSSPRERRMKAQGSGSPEHAGCHHAGARQGWVSLAAGPWPPPCPTGALTPLPPHAPRVPPGPGVSAASCKGSDGRRGVLHALEESQGSQGQVLQDSPGPTSAFLAMVGTWPSRTHCFLSTQLNATLWL